MHESAEGVVPAATSGYDQYKNVNGRKRHILVDTLGLLIAVAVLLRAGARGTRPALAWADHDYSGAAWAAWSRETLGTAIEIVEQPRDQTGFRACPCPGAAAGAAGCLGGVIWYAVLTMRTAQPPGTWRPARVSLRPTGPRPLQRPPQPACPR